MRATPILDRIRAQGGDVIRDRWRVRLRRGRLDDRAVAWLRAHSLAVIREAWPDHDEWAERAGIRRFEGGQESDEAEAEAYSEVAGRCSI